MRLITAPEVFLTGRLTPNHSGIDSLMRAIDAAGSALDAVNAPLAEQPVVIGSRTCYQSFDKGRPHAEHVRNLIDSGHGSCLEHAVWQVVLTGISRSCGRELLRHRHLSPSELSQRYCDMTNARIVIPPDYLEDHREWLDGALDCAFSKWLDSIKGQLQLYSEWCGTTKRTRQAARSLLPECVETRICFTGNARAWRNLFERRCHEAADVECRRAANAVYTLLLPEAPNVFGDYTRKELDDGTFTLSTETRGV